MEMERVGSQLVNDFQIAVSLCCQLCTSTCTQAFMFKDVQRFCLYWHIRPLLFIPVQFCLSVIITLMQQFSKSLGV